MLKRFTATPTLLVVFVGSLLLAFGLDSLVPPSPAQTPLAIPVLGVISLLTSLAALTVLLWRVGLQRSILLCGALAFLLCGLFPPWRTAFKDSNGHTRTTRVEFSSLVNAPAYPTYPYSESRIASDVLCIEWLCIAVAAGTVWLFVSKPEREKDAKV